MPLLRRSPAHCFAAALLFLACAAHAVRAAEPEPVNKGLTAPKAVLKAAPESVEDLKAIESHVKKVLAKVMPCVVGVQIGRGEGSGVIISADGKVLTAGHVSGKPGQDAVIRLPDGKKLKAKTLGNNSSADSGMLQITDEGTVPFVELGKSAELKKGQWVICLGHPGGFKEKRTPPLRLGRVIDPRKDFIYTDCTLVGGDSGGPLFDMEGRVVGIHSQIREATTSNLHVPADTFRDSWDRLAKGESWGGFMVGRRGAYLGVESDPEADECRIGRVLPESPAAKGGLKAGDVVTRLGEARIGKFPELMEQIARKRPNEEVVVEVRRGEISVTLKIKLESAPRS